jgi:tetratricopeptide (TPR) repeat protein
MEESINAARSQIAEHEWKDPSGATFNNHYKVLGRAFAAGGIDAVERAIRKATDAKGQAVPQTVAECLAAGGALVEQQQVEEAKPIYARALELEPDNAAALCKMGVCVGCTGAPLNGARLMARADRATTSTVRGAASLAVPDCSQRPATTAATLK